jgi:hypothetical protein
VVRLARLAGRGKVCCLLVAQLSVAVDLLTVGQVLADPAVGQAAVDMAVVGQVVAEAEMGHAVAEAEVTQVVAEATVSLPATGGAMVEPLTVAVEALATPMTATLMTMLTILAEVVVVAVGGPGGTTHHYHGLTSLRSNAIGTLRNSWK